ncbi:MAG: hypothetical protein IKF97_05880 [Clostridia bacterium]|nr:hypothetical protein [Clostridia bacterium]
MDSREYKKYIQELELHILEYDLLSEDDKSRFRKYIRTKQQERAEEPTYSRQSIAVAEKIYNDVLDYTKNSKSISVNGLTRRFKIGMSTANYLIDKMYNEGLLELRFGTYWVKGNNK